MTALHAIGDTAALSGRMLRHNIRSIDTIMTVLATPVLILLAFVFVIGGAIDIPGVRYVDYIVPVVVLMCVASGVSYTAYRINQDVSSGMMTRFLTMPIARSAILGGHTLASVAVNGVSVALVLLISGLVGYRPRADAAGWGLTIGLLLLVLIGFTLMGVTFGLAARTVEGASLFSYLLIGLLFVSSGFAPTDTMPAGLRVFADHQPLTPIINALREAQLGQATTSMWAALAWSAGICLVFGVLAQLAARRSTARQR
ncbi:ABC transporter permease [Micrococcaceae bacterium RIT802]|nr:ABC transporter permease [Micrococcaceae bacterium RIT 802]